MSTAQDPRKTWLAAGSLLTVWWKMPSLWLRLQQALAFCLKPASLPLGGQGPVCRGLALLWYSPNPLFCEWARLRIRLEPFEGKFSSFFPSLTIPQFGLLSHVSSLRLPSGHSGLVLNLSNAAGASLFSPCLLLVDVSIQAASLLGVAVRHIICGFYLFIFPPSYVAL